MRLARKKGAQVQLQAEINTNEEWEKLLEREGLIVVDIYSEWCGPCIGMVGNLKKLKVEVGGDNLHLAIAKADGIDCLKRFRKKSEPTWMFIAGGNIVNLMFGADAPRLTRLIIEELQNEALSQKNERERVQIAFDQLTPAEQVRKSISDARLAEIAEIEKVAAKAAEAERRRKRCELMAPFITELDVLLFWPHAFDGHKMIYEAWDPLGISVADKESPKLNEEQINGLFFENEEILENEAAIKILLEKPCLAILLKIHPEKGDILEKVKKVIYEDVTKCEKPPTGGEAADKVEEVFLTVADKLEMRKEDDIVIPGIYSPTDPISKAAAINILFPKTIAQFVEPEVPPLPPHVALVYDAFKRREVLEACAANEKQVLKLGFFASGDLQNVKNIGITLEEYENVHQQKEYGEKLVVMLSKMSCDTMLEFVELGPTYISPNAVEGAKECSIFFPPGYGEKPKEVVTKVKKKKGKKRVDPNKVTSAEKVDTEMSEKTAEQSIATEVEENGDRIESDDGMEALEAEEVECGDDEASPEGEDKATSPIQDGE